MGKIVFEDFPSTKTPISASNLNAMQDELINLIYPIGSIFMSVNSTNPGTYLGGTWEQIKDRFLLGAGDTHEAGSTGGEDTHQHKYGLQYSAWYGVTAIEGNDNAGLLDYYGEGEDHFRRTGQGESVGDIITSVNGAASTSTQNQNMATHRMIANTSFANNMPPYLTVYMWERVE